MIDFPVEPITPDLGSRVLIPAGHLLDEGIAEKCSNLLDERGVLVFPQIAVSDELQIAFSNRLGRMQSSRLRAKADTTADKMGIYPVTLDPGRAKFLDYIHSNEHWHMDGTTYDIPPRATNLKCEVPPASGGDTEFANLLAAYDDLPASRKSALENLRVVHSAATANLRFFSKPSVLILQRWLSDGPPREQPLVWQQASGRRTLFSHRSLDGRSYRRHGPGHGASVARMSCSPGARSPDIATGIRGSRAIWSSGTTRHCCTGLIITPWIRGA